MFEMPENKNEVWQALNAKFSSNLTIALSQESELCSRAELQARAIPVVATILSKNLQASNWQRDALVMFDEVFADVICSIYLAASGLDKPAQMLLRRALEVGVATVYLWDLPHIFWGWKNDDKDLNFNEMLVHLGSSGYDSFVKSENPSCSGSGLLDAPRARELYRKLSNIVHGKMTDFESVLPDRFQHSPIDWKTHLEQVCEVEGILIRIWQNRFRCVSERLFIEFPQLQVHGAARR